MESNCFGKSGLPRFVVLSVFLVFIALLLFAVTAAAEDPPSFFLKWGTPGSGDGEFAYPWVVAVDSAGNVYVADTGDNRIQKFSPSKNFLAKGGNHEKI